MSEIYLIFPITEFIDLHFCIIHRVNHLTLSQTASFCEIPGTRVN